VWVAVVTVIVLGLDVKDTVADVFNSGSPIREAVFIAIALPTLAFFRRSLGHRVRPLAAAA
jgi:hypothetical protein